MSFVFNQYQLLPYTKNLTTCRLKFLLVHVFMSSSSSLAPYILQTKRDLFKSIGYFIARIHSLPIWDQIAHCLVKNVTKWGEFHLSI
jgi:hypothetical protein